MSKSILLLPFLDESESFTNGFEVGILWEKMSNNEAFNMLLVHSENVEQIELMCAHYGYEFGFSDAGSGWHYFSGKPIDISTITL